ncbi:hypothetical protein M569_15040 [Genlisea aurea]|uniref:C3H1-type domain-containing protein n=1 Tax=Genlisea aurea TaxID=192259 RepID=S8BYW1_9LAMI|nr:hypothetical protein M569_15040 [Genlisea aurea]
MEGFDSAGETDSIVSLVVSGDGNSSEKRKRETETDTETLMDVVVPAPRHPLWKTSLCSYFRGSGGLCSHGDSCRFAHGEEELRPRPDNTWDPASERAKKMAKMEVEEKEETDGGGGGIMMTEKFEEGESLVAGLSKCLVNLPMKWTSDHLRNFLKEKGVLFKSAKKKKGMVVGFVSFENVEQVATAVEELDGKSVGNNRTLKLSDVLPRSFERNNKVVSEGSLPCSDLVTKAEDSINDGADSDGNVASSSSALMGRSARAAVTPLAHMSYPDQLEHKKNSLAQTLKKLTRNARKACPRGISLPEWIQKSREIGGLPCELEGIIGSPSVYGYRNKCEFSVGLSLEGKRTVGFLLGNFREGVTAVEEPVDCPNVSQIACKYAAVFQKFLQDSSFPVWNRLNNTGFWRQLTVREGRSAHCNVENSEPIISEAMLIVQVCSIGFEDQKIKDEINFLENAFSIGSTEEAPHLPLTVLVIQDHTGISNAAPADAPLKYVFTRRGEGSELGINDDVEPRIHDHISGLKFSISPSAFFQVNTSAAEKLYSLAGDWADLGPKTLLFDICCGTGTIGLTLAHRVGMVVGIEMNASAVSDAQKNAEINGIKNCKFVCGKAEDVIGALMKQYLCLLLKPDDASSSTHNGSMEHSGDENVIQQNGSHQSMESRSELLLLQQFENVVAVVDPPRVGLHPTVIKVLRTQSDLKRLIYISCNPESLVANAIELCTPSPGETEKSNNKNNNRGWKNTTSASLARHRAKSMPDSEPFIPVKAVAVDLFPHTPHCETVMLLER